MCVLQQLGDAAPSTAEVFWRAVLPESPLPDAFLRLLRPGRCPSFLLPPPRAAITLLEV